MEVIWIQEKRRFSIEAPACRHFEFDVFVGDVLLLIIHSNWKAGVSDECLRR
jgi:hypothetical protein